MTCRRACREHGDEKPCRRSIHAAGYSACNFHYVKAPYADRVLRVCRQEGLAQQLDVARARDQGLQAAPRAEPQVPQVFSFTRKRQLRIDGCSK